jgi:hypothetical protein
MAKPRTSKLAIMSFVSGCVPLALVSVITLSHSCPCIEIPGFVADWSAVSALLAPVAAVTLGYSARRDIRKRVPRLRGRRIAKTGLVLGYSWIAALLWAGLFGPSHHSRPIANEASAVGSLRTVSTAVHAYSEVHRGALPATLHELRELIDSNLANSLKSGYRFDYQLRSTHNDGILDGFEVVAEPVLTCVTGRRAFYMDETGVIRFEVIRSELFSHPTAKSPPL